MRRTILAVLTLTASVAVNGCVSEPKKSKPKTELKTEEVVLEAEPEGLKKVNTTFDDKIILAGYKLNTNKASFKPGDKVSYTLYWKVDKPLDKKGWQLFTHVFDARKKRVLNIDRVGQLREGGLQPSDWQAGKVYADEQTFKIPKNVSGDKLQVVTGIWRGDDRVKITKGLQFGRNGALAINIPLTGGAKASAWKPPTLRVDRMPKGTSIKIDGKLDEPAWAKAGDTGAFVNVGSGKPDKGFPVQGSAKVLWNDQALYVAFDVKDKDVIGGFKKTDKDPQLWTKDTVEIMIDPDGDGDNKDYYEIQVNPQNLVFDSRFDDYNKPKGGKDGPFGHQDWSAKLTSAVVVNGTLDKSDDKDVGYTVEMAIPWSSFDKAKKAPPELGATWRMNFYAMQNNSGVAWSPIMGKGNFHRASQFGRVLFAEEGFEPKKVAKAETGQKAGQAPAPTGMTAPVSATAAPRAGAKANVNPAAATPAAKPTAPAAKPAAPAAKPAAPAKQATPTPPKPAAPPNP